MLKPLSIFTLLEVSQSQSPQGPKPQAAEVTSSQIVKALPEIYPWPVTHCTLPPVDVPWIARALQVIFWGRSMGKFSGLVQNIIVY